MTSADVINIKNFGAKGDGQIDDTIAIQNAINELASKNINRLYFPSGTYKITSAITIPEMEMKIIDGDDAMIVQYTDNVPILRPMHFSTEVDTWGIYIEGLLFKYNNPQTQSGAIGLMFDSDASNGSGFYQWTLHHCWFYNCYVGISPNPVNIAKGWQLAIWDLTLDDVTFQETKHRVLNLECGIGIPNIILRDFRVFNQNVVSDDICLNFTAAGVVIENADMEGWHNYLLASSGGSFITMQDFHIEHHSIDGDCDQVFVLSNVGNFIFKNAGVNFVINTTPGWTGKIFNAHGDGTNLILENMIYSESNSSNNPRPVWFGAANLSTVKISNLDTSIISAYLDSDDTRDKIINIDNNFVNGIKIKNQNIVYGTSAPTSGTWNKGDKVFNSSPLESSPFGWVCITSGTPGVWIEENSSKSKENNYYFNLNNSCLEHYRNCINPKIVGFGDSILAGAGTTNIWSCFIKKFSDILQIFKDSYYGTGYSSFSNTSGLTNWTVESHGTNQFRIISGANASDCDLTLAVTNPKTQLTIDIIYSMETDGGSFDILVNGNTVQTVSCNGKHSYHNSISIIVPANQSLKIHPHINEKVYLEGYVHRGANGLSDGVLVHQLGHPGDYLEAYSDDEIVASISALKPDLTIIEHIINSSEKGTPVLFKQKITTAIKEAKKTGDVLLLIPCRGKTSYNYDSYVTILKNLAEQYYCGFLNIDAFIGGYTNGQSLRLMSDDTHPNQYGHDIITRLLINFLISPLSDINYLIGHFADEGNYYSTEFNISKLLGNLRFSNSPIEFKKLQGYRGANLQIGNANIVDSNGNIIICLANYGDNTGAMMQLNDFTSNKFFQMYTAYGHSYIYPSKDLIFDTQATDKIIYYVTFNQRILCNNGCTIAPISSQNASPRTIFVDSVDDILKYKDISGVIHNLY